jgi:hypothetical protein
MVQRSVAWEALGKRSEKGIGAKSYVLAHRFFGETTLNQLQSQMFIKIRSLILK